MDAAELDVDAGALEPQDRGDLGRDIQQAGRCLEVC